MHHNMFSTNISESAHACILCMATCWINIITCNTVLLYSNLHMKGLNVSQSSGTGGQYFCNAEYNEIERGGSTTIVS